MGCVPTKRSKNESFLQEKEKLLNFHNFTINQIKEAFFNLNNQNEITFENINRGLKYLKLDINSEKYQSILYPFLKMFLKESILSVDEKEYNFRSLMAIFFLFSNSDKTDKYKAIFRIFDQANNGKMNYHEFSYMIDSLLKIVDSYSDGLIYNSDSEKNSTRKIEKEMFLESRVINIIYLTLLFRY